MIEVMLNVIVIYTDWVTEEFEAIQIIKNGLVIGRIINNKFIECGFIPKNNVKDIFYDYKMRINSIN